MSLLASRFPIFGPILKCKTANTHTHTHTHIQQVVADFGVSGVISRDGGAAAAASATISLTLSDLSVQQGVAGTLAYVSCSCPCSVPALLLLLHLHLPLSSFGSCPFFYKPVFQYRIACWQYLKYYCVMDGWMDGGHVMSVYAVEIRSLCRSDTCRLKC